MVQSVVVTRKVFGNIDFLGAPREMRSEEQLKVIAQEYEDISFVILSDIWLDQPKVHDLFDAFLSRCGPCPEGGID